MRPGLHLLAGLGCAAGSVARYGATGAAQALGAAPAVGLGAANLAGSLLIAAYTAWAARSPRRSGEGASFALLATGFCGGFTSLSAVALARFAGFAETPLASAVLLGGQGAGWLGAAALGAWLGRRLA